MTAQKSEPTEQFETKAFETIPVALLALGQLISLATQIRDELREQNDAVKKIELALSRFRELVEEREAAERDREGSERMEERRCPTIPTT